MKTARECWDSRGPSIFHSLSQPHPSVFCLRMGTRATSVRLVVWSHIGCQWLSQGSDRPVWPPQPQSLSLLAIVRVWFLELAGTLWGGQRPEVSIGCILGPDSLRRKLSLSCPQGTPPDSPNHFLLLFPLFL